RAQDLEFHHVDPAKSLGLALAQTPKAWEITRADITEATHEPPSNTRAHARSELMHLLKEQTCRYFVDWEVIDAEGINSLNLLNPFDADPEQMTIWTKLLKGASGSS